MRIDYKTFFQESFDLLCVMQNSVFVKVNDASKTILGYSPKEMEGVDWRDLVHPLDLHRTEKAFEHFSTSTFINRYTSKSGKAVWLEWGHPTIKGNKRYIVARDISLRVETQERVDKYLARFHLKAKALERSNEDLEQFAYAASHDLQTPLRQIQGFTKHLAKEYEHLFDDKAKLYMDHLTAAVAKSRDQIDGLLQFSRVGRNSTLSQFNLDHALDDALLILGDDITSKNVEIERGLMPIVKGDRPLLTAVFQNLIGNAVKFRHKDRPPRVTISSTDKGDRWQISVADNGVGMEPKYVDRIFVIFQRLATDKNGTGVGLALCKKIVEYHQGELWVDTALDEGSTFHFTLPKERINGGPPSEPSSGNPLSRR